MATTILRPLRVWRNHYACDECPNEWSDELLTQGVSWCPCCDKEIEPYASEALFVDVEVEDEEDSDEGIGPSLYVMEPERDEPDPDLLREMHAERMAILKEIA